MLGEHYPLFQPDNEFVFEFYSQGEKGEIKKAVIFEPLSFPAQDAYNLALCTFRNGIAVDHEVTNNKDFLKTMYTVAKAVYEFCDVHPDSSIQIGANDKRRLTIYNGIFKRRYAEIIESFDIMGINGGNAEPYNPEKFYGIFEIRPKKG